MEPRHHKGWYVPRDLPHFDAAETTQAITFRLADSLPHAVAVARKDEDDLAYRRRITAALDAGFGECLLRDHRIALIVEGTLLHGSESRYDPYAWVVMPNHVHVLIRQAAGYRLSDTVQGWKSWSARQINRYRGTRGTVWQREYFDRYIRNQRHFDATVAYLEGNPVSAQLVATPEQWRFSSAWWRVNRSEPSAH